MSKLKQLLDEIDRLFVTFRNRRPLDVTERAIWFKKLRAQWTYHSNALEGNSLTLGETIFYLREGLTSEGKPLVDYLEARNHAEAIDWLLAYIKEGRSITEGFLKDLNALLHTGITERPAMDADGKKFMRPITPGVYKSAPNHVLTLSGEIHRYVEPLRVPEEMERLIFLMQKNERGLHPVALAAKAHHEFTRIHPFDDCNGRVARLLMNLMLMRADYPPIVIKLEERRTYLEALEAADRGNDEPFNLFVAEHVKEALIHRADI